VTVGAALPLLCGVNAGAALLLLLWCDCGYNPLFCCEMIVSCVRVLSTEVLCEGLNVLPTVCVRV
jgi:hypothetical protein